MKEFIDKLISRLEEKKSHHLNDELTLLELGKSNAANFCSGKATGIDGAIKIVNEFAGEYNPKTNADRIRSMSDEELANTLVQDVPCKICEYWSEEISSCNAPFSFVCTKGYAEALYLKWLQSEAE